MLQPIYSCSILQKLDEIDLGNIFILEELNWISQTTRKLLQPSYFILQKLDEIDLENICILGEELSWVSLTV